MKKRESGCDRPTKESASVVFSEVYNRLKSVAKREEYHLSALKAALGYYRRRVS